MGVRGSICAASRGVDLKATDGTSSSSSCSNSSELPDGPAKPEAGFLLGHAQTRGQPNDASDRALRASFGYCEMLNRAFRVA